MKEYDYIEIKESINKLQNKILQQYIQVDIKTAQNINI